MKKEVILLSAIVALLWGAAQTAAVGLSPVSITIPFSPESEQIITVTLLNSGNEPINATLLFSGVMAKYVVFKQERYFFLSPHSSQQLNATIRFAEKVEPGSHSITMVAKEVPFTQQHGISVFGEVSGDIRFFVPYPGTYASINLYSKDANINEPVTLLLHVENLGKHDISTIITTVDIFDQQQTPKESLVNTIRNLEAGQREELTLTLDPQKYVTGDYRAVAYGKYNAIKTNEKEVNFRIGTLFVNITSANFIPYSERIFKILINLQSRWNLPLENVYATVDIYNQNNELVETLKTPSTNLNPWGEATISSFWDAKEKQPGPYTAKLILHYADKETINIIPLTIEELSSNLRSAMMTIVMIMLIVVIDYVWLRRRNKKQENHLVPLRGEL